MRNGVPERVSASTPASWSTSGPCASRVIRSMAPIGLSPAVTARASISATTGNSAMISASRLLTASLSHQSRPSTPAAAQATISSTRISGFDCPSSTASTPMPAPAAAPSGAPHHLLDAELVDRQPASRGAASRRSTDARPPRILSMNRTASRTSGAVSRPSAVAVPPVDRAGQQPRRPGGIGEVRRDPIAHGRPAQRRRGKDREQQPGRGESAEQAADHRQAHRSTRRSSGSRPILIISR